MIYSSEDEFKVMLSKEQYGMLNSSLCARTLQTAERVDSTVHDGFMRTLSEAQREA
jgi:hypothetical protein